MSEKNNGQFDYDDWVQDALRGVLRQALEALAASQEPGEHHFYINFQTTHSGVSVPGFLRAQYPEEVTIVLQHQFEDLYVEKSGFEVTLSFSGQRHRLIVPFTADTSFADPSVNFGLQLGQQTTSEPDIETDDDRPGFQKITRPQGTDDKVSELSGNTPGQNKRTGAETERGADRDDDASDGGADVISIEAFRNK